MNCPPQPLIEAQRKRTMNAKQKTVFRNFSWKETRGFYTWHLRPPHKDEFDNTHWWEGRSDVDSIAALTQYRLWRKNSVNIGNRTGFTNHGQCGNAGFRQFQNSRMPKRVVTKQSLNSLLVIVALLTASTSRKSQQV